MKILITGGCGFIGSSLTNELLKTEHEIYIIDNLSLGKNYWEKVAKKPILFTADILDYRECERIFSNVKPDIVIHLAAHHYIPFCEKNMHSAYMLNVNGTINILECCRVHSVKKFFFASTGDVYVPSNMPHKETDAIDPIYVYGHTKYLGEQICLRYLKSIKDPFSLIIGRLFNAAGPRETNPHFLPEVVKQIVGGKRRIEVGNLWPKRDFVDVTSMGGVIKDIILRTEGFQIVNIGSGIVQEVGDVLQQLVSVLDFKVEIVSVPERQRQNDRPYLCTDATNLKKLIGRAAKPFDADTAKEIFSGFTRQ